jgi:hypothetical protein
MFCYRNTTFPLLTPAMTPSELRAVFSPISTREVLGILDFSGLDATHPSFAPTIFAGDD